MSAVVQAIDHTTQVLSLQYNRVQPVIFNTYQAYLKDSHTRLMEDMERARREGYTFAAKLVSHSPVVVVLHVYRMC
jgi:proline dehydrogenase